ncbi:MAG: nucleotide exchange factor GrpE [Spirochaetales bacterium]|nr:nucleotide exchange factor GrpE [Spirochaetales bacterium]
MLHLRCRVRSEQAVCGWMGQRKTRLRKNENQRKREPRGMSDGEPKSRDPREAKHRQQAAVGSPADQGAVPENEQLQQVRELENRNAELESENSSLKDELLRKAADFENFRKRMFRDKEEAIKYANADLLNDVLPIIDDFERAIQSAGESKDFEAFHAGVSLIERQLVSVLERNWGLKRFSASGELFDPERHEAIAAEESQSHEDAVVLEEYLKGYTLHDRVLRPAKVKVAKPVSPKQTGDNNSV